MRLIQDRAGAWLAPAGLWACVVLAAGCAPVYLPSAAHVPVLRHQGNVAGSGQIGFQGFQVNGAYAVDDHVAVRGTVHSTLGLEDATYYHLFSTGASVFWAQDDDPRADPKTRGAGLFAALSAEAGVALARGEVQLDGMTEAARNAGTVLRAAGQVDVGYESRVAMAGLSARTVRIRVYHDEAPTAGVTRSSAVFLEPLAILRVGPPGLYLEAQGGLWLPLAVQGDVGIPWPVILSFGIGGRL